MAHFLKPPGSGSESYDPDNKLASGSLWCVRLTRRRKTARRSGQKEEAQDGNSGLVRSLTGG